MAISDDCMAAWACGGPSGGWRGPRGQNNTKGNRRIECMNAARRAFILSSVRQRFLAGIAGLSGPPIGFRESATTCWAQPGASVTVLRAPARCVTKGLSKGSSWGPSPLVPNAVIRFQRRVLDRSCPAMARWWVSWSTKLFVDGRPPCRGIGTAFQQYENAMEPSRCYAVGPAAPASLFCRRELHASPASGPGRLASGVRMPRSSHS